MNRRNALHILGASGVGAAIPAQLPAETMLNEFIRQWKTTGDYTLAMLNAMPAENFNFKPTPVQMSFGKQFTHLGYFNTFLFGFTKDKAAIPEPETADKESAQNYLTETFDYCAGILSDLTEEDMAIVDNPNKPNWLARNSNRNLLMRAYIHTAHHRGQAVVYLRLKDVKPAQFRV